MKRVNAPKRFLRFLCLLCLLCLLPAGSLAASPPGDYQARYADRFLKPGEPPGWDGWVYRSESLYISVQTERYLDSDVFWADIYLSDLSQLRRAYGGGKWGVKSQKIPVIAKNENAVLAMTGDSSRNLSKGPVFGNGVLLRDSTNRKRQLCLIDQDGVMRILEGKDLTREDIRALEGSVWQGFLFGPALLDEQGKALTAFASDVKPANPRAVIGYFEPGHYCLIQVDGRGTKGLEGKTNKGLTMAQLAQLAEHLGLTQAYNLDGGQSAAMWLNGEIISHPYHGGRAVSDIICIVEKP